MTELKESLSTCKDSAPGLDGIPYSFYKAFPDLLLKYVIESWELALLSGNLADSNKRSCITLLPKKGKDLSFIEGKDSSPPLIIAAIADLGALHDDRVAVSAARMIVVGNSDFIQDKNSHRETKDPYFTLIHEVEFCDKVLAEFGMSSEGGLIVNGHVPVKVEKGESPLKRSGKAITIDGAFSEAYGDYGYTLVLEPNRIVLAEHHHFESVDAAIRDGIDIVPNVKEIKVFNKPRRQRDTERGQRIRYRLEMLERLIEAYQTNRLHEHAKRSSANSIPN